MVIEDSNTKRCNKCGETKPVVEFSKDRTKRDGLNTLCKPCRSAGNAKWRLRNPEKIKENNANWYADNREHAIAYSKAYRLTHLEQVKDSISRWCDRNKERKTTGMKTWNERNKEYRKKKNREYLEANRDKKKTWHQNRRARKANGKISSNRVKELLALQKGKCVLYVI